MPYTPFHSFSFSGLIHKKNLKANNVLNSQKVYRSFPGWVLLLCPSPSFTKHSICFFSFYLHLSTPSSMDLSSEEKGLRFLFIFFVKGTTNSTKVLEKFVFNPFVNCREFFLFSFYA